MPAYIESLAFPYVSVAARHGALTRSLSPWVLAQLRRLDVLHSIQFPDIASPLSRRTAFVTAWPRRDLPAPNPKSACLVPDYRSYSTALSRLLAPRILRRLSTARTLPSPQLYITKTNDSYLLALWPFMDLISRTVLIMLEIHGLTAKSCG